MSVWLRVRLPIRLRDHQGRYPTLLETGAGVSAFSKRATLGNHSTISLICEETCGAMGKREALLISPGCAGG